MKTLVVIDMQNDFITGPLGSPEAREIIPRIQHKVDDYLLQDKVVLFTQDTHYKDYLETQEGQNLPIKHCLSGTKGWEIIPELDRQGNLKVFTVKKTSFGYDHWVSKGNLFGISPNSGAYSCIGKGMDIELVGVCTDICVVSNALLLKNTFPEAKITVDASCCAGTTPEKHKAALEVMKSCQINIINE